MNLFLSLTLISFLFLIGLSGCGGSGDFVFTGTQGQNGVQLQGQNGNQLQFLTQPLQRAGEPLRSFQVGVFDSEGNLLPLDGVVITITSTGNTLSGDLQETTVAGVATFNNVVSETASGSLTLTASADGLTAAISTQFVVDANDPSQANFTTPLVDLDAGTNFNFSVAVVDDFGNPVPGVTVNVQVLEDGTNNVIPTSGDTTVTSGADGVATFNNLSTDQAGMVFLRITVGQASVDSTVFVVDPSDPDTVTFSTAPSNLNAGDNFNFTVNVVDEFGNPVPGATVNVQVLEDGTNNVIPTTGDTTATSGADGTTTFNNFSANQAGMVFLRITVGQAMVDSAVFEVGPGDPDTITFLTAPSNLNVGDNFNFTVNVVDEFGNPVPGATVNAQVLENGTNNPIPVTGTTSATTDANGVATFDSFSADQAGNAFLRITTGTASSDSPAFTVVPPAARFDTFLNFGTGDFPFSLAIADVNRDTNADLVTANFQGGDLSLLLGNGDGTFQVAQSFGVGSFPRAVAVADVNRDTNPDLVSAHSGSNDLAVLLGNGDGTFQAARNFAAGNQPFSVAVGDVNADTFPDLVSANQFGNDLSVLLGNGDGTFQPAQNIAAGSRPTSIVIADVNGDTSPDLVTASFAGGNLTVLLGNGDGTFQAARSFAAGNFPRAVAVADVNGDSELDLVSANFLGDDLSVLLGNGDGTFQAAQNFAAGDQPFSVAIADVNGDSNPDVIIANELSDDLSVLVGNGDGTFQAAQSFGVGDGPRSVAVADVDGDGNPDLVSANGNGDDLTVVLNGLP